MNIKYDHATNVHTLEGPRAAFVQIFSPSLPTSLLDVGCGVGYWLAAATESGVGDIMGIDGVDIPRHALLFPANRFQQKDLTAQVDLGRRFDAALCLEVGEHLDIAHAPILIDTLTRHADFVLFSAACPGQIGQNHVNGQWPAWWQALFNERGFSCEDAVRWRIWDDARVEPWYRQNMFVARRNPHATSHESRIKPAIHPDMLPYLMPDVSYDKMRVRVEQGLMPLRWYGTTMPKAIWANLGRRLFRGRQE
jgi:SAM-dependent methyltransferase